MTDPFNCEVSRIRDETFQKINTYGTKSCLDMEKLWYKIFGPNKDVVVERYNTIGKHIIELFEEMVKEETETFCDHREELSGLVKMSSELRKELSVNIELPFDVNLDGCNLRKQVKDIKSYLEKYRKIKDDRLRILAQYKLEEEKLCEKLGQDSTLGSYNDVPSESKLKEIKTQLSTLTTELAKRSKTFRRLVNEIEEIVRDLEVENDLDPDQRAILANNVDILSEQKLKTMERWKLSLLELQNAQVNEIKSLKDQTMLLWNRLDVSAQERERILAKTHKPCGKTVINIWTKELEHCQQLKKANMMKVILRLREVIADLWDVCHVDDEQRALFTDYFSENFNDELLESHEQEEQNLRKYYEETKDLYALADRWFELWNKMITLDSRSTNANRLNNRGGQLLKEEKERKAVQKELPKVESKLEKKIADFEAAHDKPFLYEGHPLMEVIAQYWDNRRMEKENEKEFRKIQNQTRVTPSAVSTSRHVAASPLSSNRKRCRPTTPVENVSVKKPVAQRQLKMATTSAKGQTTRRRSRSQDPAGRYEPKLLRSASANSSVVSYTGFQNYLENKSKTTTSGMSLRSSPSPTRAGKGLATRSNSNSALFKTPTSAAKSATKRARLNNFGSSKICRPMIN